MKISTLNDAREMRYLAATASIIQSERTQLRRKIKRWEKKVTQFGGLVHQNVLDNLRTQLAALS